MTIVTTPSYQVLERAIVTMIAAVTEKPCELCAAPDDITYDAEGRLVDPYCVIYPLTGVASHVALDGVTGTVKMIQVTNVGSNADQAQWMADASRKALTSRGSNGDWTNPITASDALVIDRRLREDGGPEPSGGSLWQVADTYDLEVIAQ